MNGIGAFRMRCLKCHPKLIRVVGLDWEQFDFQASCRFGKFHLLSLVNLVRGIHQYRDARRRWNGGLQQLKLLCNEIFGDQCREAGHVASRMRKALDQTDRIGSATAMKTSGIIGAELWIAIAFGPFATRISGRSATSSARSGGMRSGSAWV